jgi:hypothetical protein
MSRGRQLQGEEGEDVEGGEYQIQKPQDSLPNMYMLISGFLPSLRSIVITYSSLLNNPRN